MAVMIASRVDVRLGFAVIPSSRHTSSLFGYPNEQIERRESSLFRTTNGGGLGLRRRGLWMVIRVIVGL